MKKNILFVDDQPLVLQGLKRMLRRQRDEWDMTFSPDGPAALDELEKKPFDVIVSDMRMPGMNGAELLNKALKKHPQVARIVLSGYAEQDMVLESLGSIHIYLSKPCEPKTLVDAIERCCSLQDSLADNGLKQALGSMQHLPALPEVYQKISERLESPEVQIEELGEIVTEDIGMTANLLKFVNSAYFGSMSQISTPTEVIAHLGIETTKSLILALDVFNKFSPHPLGLLNLKRLWSHSMEVGMTARSIAAQEDKYKKIKDDCFIAGLLHDVGKLLLAVNFPDKYDQVVLKCRESGVTASEAEQEIFGTTHGIAGSYLLGLWGLPEPIVDAVANHETPANSPAREFCPNTAVHVADCLARSNENLSSSKLIDKAYLQSIELLDRLDIWRSSIDA